MGGSSGSPVLNKQHQVIAVNNSGYAKSQGFNYGVRLKYLIELINKINSSIDFMEIDMIEIDLREINDILGSIIGESYDEELLDTIFKNFCLGK